MRWAAALLLTLHAATAQAHVGSPDVFWEGRAGAYTLLVQVRPPDVIPGTAVVDVRVVSGDARSVALQPLYFETGRDGVPRADAALRDPSDTHMWRGTVWLMEPGSASIHIALDGQDGKAEALVPVPALATARRGMDTGLAAVLLGLAATLVIGAVALAGASAREAVLGPGAVADAKLRRRARVNMAVAALAVTGALYGGAGWWTRVDASYLRHLYKPLELRITPKAAGDRRLLALQLHDPGWLERAATDLVPDHGKLMHLFVVREPAADAFAHLHPVRTGPDAFSVPLPPLPDGTYRVFADVVHADGLPETLATSIALGGPVATAEAAPLADPDEAWLLAAPTTDDHQGLSDGSSLRWEHGPLVAGRLEPLRFAVSAPDGAGALLEPYMGMTGHMVVLRDDGSVFVHVHPTGTVPMASSEAFEQRVAVDAGHAGHAATPLAFPWAFPKAGRYSIWVQVRRAGQVLTGAFTAQVADAVSGTD